MGGGLGDLLIGNSVLGPLAGRVKAVAVLQSVHSLEAFIREQRHKWMARDKDTPLTFRKSVV